MFDFTDAWPHRFFWHDHPSKVSNREHYQSFDRHTINLRLDYVERSSWGHYKTFSVASNGRARNQQEMSIHYIMITAWISNHIRYKVWGEIFLSIPKLQRLPRWNLGMDKQSHPTHCNGCDYLFILGLMLIHVSKRGPWWRMFTSSWGYVLPWGSNFIGNGMKKQWCFVERMRLKMSSVKCRTKGRTYSPGVGITNLISSVRTVLS